jgi:predicted HTH domain antitoxin
MEQVSILDKLDLLIDRHVYPDRAALIRDAMQALLRSRPELRRYLAVDLYQQSEVSLARAAEIGGVDIETMKEILREAGVARSIPPVGAAIREEVAWLRQIQQDRSPRSSLLIPTS